MRADNLCKRYGPVLALDNVSLTAYAGECFGIFGLSGSGKSTLMRVLAGIERPDSGAVSGRPSTLCAQFPVTEEALSPFEALWFYAAMYGIPKGKRQNAVREALTLVGLDAERNRRIKKLRGGARKLIEIARTLLSPHSLRLLDDPMAGLDFNIRRRLWEHLLKIRSRDKVTIIVATARSEDAEICDRIALLHEGRVLGIGTPAQLRGLTGPEALVIKPLKAEKSRKHRGWSGVLSREQDDSLVVEIGPESKPVDLLREISGDIAGVRMKNRTLDQVLSAIVRARSSGGLK